MVNITRGFNLDFAFQSQKIPFDEWIEITTLCLAPLIAHIIAGVPEPTFLDQKQPKWHQRVTLYNPTTILWRYFSIFDRRIRAKSWNPFTMAASNAIFWTDQGWNGSEEMIKKSREHCLRKPASSHIDLISSSAAKTLIVTLQGVQALYTLIQGLSLEGNRKYGDTLGFHYLFVPLAIIGLIRLLSAYWLTEDYHFAHVESAKTYHQTAQHNRRTEAQTGFTADYASTSLLPLSTAELENAFHPVLSWRGILSRALFIILLLPLWLITGYYIASKRSRYTVATFLINLFYFVALTGGILIHFILFCSGRSRTTIIPCVSAPWYQVYTWFLYAFVVVTMVVAGLQTRRSPCGRYTTFGTHLDATLCPDLFNSTTGVRLNSTMSAVDLRRYIN